MKYQTALTSDRLLEIEQLINAVNEFYNIGEYGYKAEHKFYKTDTYMLKIKHELLDFYQEGYLCSNSQEKIFNLDRREIFRINDEKVEFHNDLYIEMNKAVYGSKKFIINPRYQFDYAINFIKEIENAINKKIVLILFYSFIKRAGKIIPQLNMRTPNIIGKNNEYKEYRYDIDGFLVNEQSYWRKIFFKSMPDFFEGLDEEYVIKAENTTLMQELKLLHY